MCYPSLPWPPSTWLLLTHTTDVLNAPHPSGCKSCINSSPHGDESIQATLYRAGFITRLEPQLWHPIPSTGNAAFRADPLVAGTEGLLHCFVDVAVTCPTIPLFAPRAQFRQGTAAARKFRRKINKHERQVDNQLRSLALRARWYPLDVEDVCFLKSQVALVTVSHAVPHLLGTEGFASGVVVDPLENYGLALRMSSHAGCDGGL